MNLRWVLVTASAFCHGHVRVKFKSIGLALEVYWLKDADEAGRGSKLVGRSVHPWAAQECRYSI